MWINVKGKVVTVLN